MSNIIALAFTLATVCLLAAQTTAVGICQKAELGSLLTNKNTTLCASTSGVVFAELEGAPSDDQLTDICKTDSCLSLMAAILVINPEDCTLPLNENLQLMSELVDPVVTHCTTMGIEINGSSLVGSGSGSGSSLVGSGSEANVGDDSQASGSGSSGASSSFQASLVNAASIVVVMIGVFAL